MQRQACGAQALARVHGPQGIPAQFKKVVVCADFIQSQHHSENVRDAEFQRAGRWPEGRGEGWTCAARRWQGTTVQLAVLGQRKGLQLDESCRHHVIRQPRPQVIAQLREGWWGGQRNDIGDQLRAIVRMVGSGHHCARLDGTVARQLAFDFADFDAEAPDLHLLVHAPQVFEFARRPGAREIAGAIERLAQPRARIGPLDKALGGQGGSIQVALAHALAAHKDLPHRSGFGVRQSSIEQMDAQVGDGHANHTAAVGLDICAQDHAVHGMHRGLGDAVHVHELGCLVAVAFDPEAQHLKFERLAAENHQAQGKAVWRPRQTGIRLHQHAKRRRRLVQYCHVLAHQDAQQRLGCPRHLLRHHDQSSSMDEAIPDFPNREVEGVRMAQHPHVIRAEAEPVPGRCEQACDIVMRNLASFGAPARAGRVDHVDRVVRPGLRPTVMGAARAIAAYCRRALRSGTAARSVRFISRRQVCTAIQYK